MGSATQNRSQLFSHRPVPEGSLLCGNHLLVEFGESLVRGSCREIQVTLVGGGLRVTATYPVVHKYLL